MEAAGRVDLSAFRFEPSDLQFWCLHDGAHLPTLEHPAETPLHVFGVGG